MVDPISQDEPVQPVRQTKPWYANLPQEEDLSSAPVKSKFNDRQFSKIANLII